MKKAEGYWVHLYIAGAKAQVNNLLRSYFILKPMCVTLKDVDYVYTGGQQAGVEIGFINYAKLPADNHTIENYAIDVAYYLLDKLGEMTCTVLTPTKSWYLERSDSCPANPKSP